MVQRSVKDVQQSYLKRHGNEEWNLIFCFQGLSWELDRFAADGLLSKLDEHQVEVVIDYDSLKVMGWRNPDRYNVGDFELHYRERYLDRFCAVCFGRLPHNPFKNHECE